MLLFICWDLLLFDVLLLCDFRQTAKMIAETAVCLALDKGALPLTYGVLTPATALGSVLRERLNARGVDFYLDAVEGK